MQVTENTFLTTEIYSSLKSRSMKTWLINNKLPLLGVVLGAIAGFLYWKYVGCFTGTCAITSNPTRSTIYFAVMGGLVFALFKNNKKKEIASSSL